MSRIIKYKQIITIPQTVLCTAASTTTAACLLISHRTGRVFIVRSASGVTNLVMTGSAVQFSSLVDNKHKFLDGRLNLLIRIVRFSHT